MLLGVSRLTLTRLGRYMSSCGCQTSNNYQRHAFTVMYGECGDPADVLVGKDVPIPQLNENEVLVKMVAASINPADINLIQGVYGTKANLPAVPGSEGVGVIEAVGSRVNDLKLGDHVIPLSMHMGTWRTHLIGASDNFMSIDKRIPFHAAVTVVINPGTALMMLKYFGAQAGDTVIQNGANSAVGQALIQIAKKSGIKTVNIVRERENFKELADYLSSLGADYVLTDAELRKPEVREIWKNQFPRPKLAIDCVAGKSGAELLRQLSPGGVLVNYGGMSKQPLFAPASALIFKEISIRGFWFSKLRERSSKSEITKMITEVGEMIIKKEFQPPLQDLVNITDFHDAVRKTLTPFLSQKQILVMDNRLKE